MGDAECLDPTLLAKRKRDEISELDDLLPGELRPHARHQRVVYAIRVPHEMAGVQERRLLPFVKSLRALEIEQLVVVLLGRRLLSSRESSLRASVVAVDGLRDIDPAELLQ